jgi:hypothetical protein
MNICKQCQNTIPLTKYKKIFCSKSCAATFNNLNRLPRTAESKQKTSITLKKLISDGVISKPTPPRKYNFPYTKLYGRYNCHSCNKSFWRTSYEQKCCSTICRDNIRSQNKCKKFYLEYYNKNDEVIVNLQSNWEVKIATWLDENRIVWSRPTKRFKWYDTTLCKKRTYLPDFYLTKYNCYLDVKNPIKMEEDKDKIYQLMSMLPLYVGNILEIKKYVADLAGLEPACIH